MAWCTQTDLVNAITEETLIDYCDDVGTRLMDAAALVFMNAAIASAEAEIQGYLYERYPSECAAKTSDSLIDQIALCITVRNLNDRRPSAGITISWANRIERAFNNLESLAKGRMTPPTWGADTDLITVGETHYPETQHIHEMEADQEIISL